MPNKKCICCLRDDLPTDPNDCTCGPVCKPCGVYQEASADWPDTPEHLARHNIHVDSKQYWAHGTTSVGSAI